MLKQINPKVKRAISIIIHVVGSASFLLVVYALFTTWVAFTDPVVTPNQITNELDADPGNIPENVVVKSKVSEIKRVPLYGYGYKVSDNMFIVNFSRGDFKVGDKVKFRVAGAVKVGDAYLVNADYE